MKLKPKLESQRIQRNLPKVILVGRTNVGKSCLFNRFAKKRVAIVESERHTTRDYVALPIKLGKTQVDLVDMGGYSFSDIPEFGEQINLQVEQHLKGANLIIFICDGSTGLHTFDERFVAKLRSHQKKSILVINKLDGPERFADADEFYRLGFEHIVKISALNGLGVDNLIEHIQQRLPEVAHASGLGEYDFSITIAGEPNSGKSTYFNALLQEERAIVSEVPGTTRDTLSEWIEFDNKRILIKDTAGIRPLGKLKDAANRFSLLRTKRAIQESEITLLICDGTCRFGRLAKQIAQMVADFKKPAVVVVNKWDKIKNVEQARFERYLRGTAHFLEDMPIVFISAANRRDILKPLELAAQVYENHMKQIKTNALNELLAKIKRMGRVKENVRLKYITQVSTAPPRFLLMGRRISTLKDTTLVYIKSSIKKTFALTGTPIELITKEEEK